MYENVENRLTAVMEKTSTGFSAYFKEMPGATVGESVSEMKENLQEMLDLHIEALEEDGEDAQHLRNARIELLFDVDQIFSHYSMINKSAFAKYLGINQSLFRKYTSGLAKASDDRVKQINEGLHRLGEELSAISLQ